MSERTYYQRNRETVLNRAKYYFEKSKEKEKKQKKEKNVKRKFGRNKYVWRKETKSKRI